MVCPIVVSADGKKQRYKQTNYIDYIITGVTGIIGVPSAKKFAVVLRYKNKFYINIGLVTSNQKNERNKGKRSIQII